MTTKKVTTKRPAKGKANTEELIALAHHLAEALRIMGTADFIPARIYDYFADTVNELHNLANGDGFNHSAAYIGLHLAELARKGGAQ